MPTPDTFAAHPERTWRALQAYLILQAAAGNRQTLTYKMLGKAMGYTDANNAAGTLARVLDHIAQWCQHYELPVITVLIVNRNTGLPGPGLSHGIEDFNTEREAVFKYPWLELVPPTPEHLAEIFHH